MCTSNDIFCLKIPTKKSLCLKKWQIVYDISWKNLITWVNLCNFLSLLTIFSFLRSTKECGISFEVFSDCECRFCTLLRWVKKKCANWELNPTPKFHDFTTMQNSCKQIFLKFFTAILMSTKVYNFFSKICCKDIRILPLFDTKTRKIVYFCNIFIRKHLKKL